MERGVTDRIDDIFIKAYRLIVVTRNLRIELNGIEVTSFMNAPMINCSVEMDQRIQCAHKRTYPT